MRSKDGAWKWILGRGRVVAYDKAGKPVLLSGTNTDITERKQAEKALRASEARLAAILNQLPVGVGVIDTCGRFILRNALMRTCMSGMMPSRDPAQRHRWHAVETAERPIPPEQWPGARALRGESVVPGMEFIHTEAGGRERWLIVSAVPGNLKENEIGAIVVAQDITELKEAEHALRDTNEELSEYTYAVVHNLKAPFRAVQNYANFLIEDLGDSLAGEPRQFLDGIKSALKQAHHQFSDLDALYRIRNYEAEFETLDLGPLLNEFASVHRTASDRQLIISDRWPVVRGERLLMSQILAELINNGFKYNRSDTKTVEVGWQPAADGRRLEIFVRDNGIGIDPQYYEHIFHIFKRLHTEEEYEGTGIGLAIVRRAVKKIGGGLRIESAAGKGSTFVISLPSALIEE
jgi:signal transduction histidine kinase